MTSSQVKLMVLVLLFLVLEMRARSANLGAVDGLLGGDMKGFGTQRVEKDKRSLVEKRRWR